MYGWASHFLLVNMFIHCGNQKYCRAGFFHMDFIFVNDMRTKIESKQNFLRYTTMYARVPYYMKIKSQRKFQIHEILSCLSLPTV